jgi:hypothetical protein
MDLSRKRLAFALLLTATVLTLNVLLVVLGGGETLFSRI